MINEKSARNSVINTRVSEQDRQNLQIIAGQTGEDQSEIIRRLVREEADRIKKENRS